MTDLKASVMNKVVKLLTAGLPLRLITDQSVITPKLDRSFSHTVRLK